VINLLESQGLIKVVADTRTEAGTREVFGGAYPAAVLYVPGAFITEKPRTTQALVNALVRGLRWIAARSADEIAAVMPPDYALGNSTIYAQSIKTSMPMYSRDGRFSSEAAETAYSVLKAFDLDVGRAKIDVAATYTNAFVGKVPTQP
jgi:NitT/TauT family transport system substrate-binding protein